MSYTSTLPTLSGVIASTDQIDWSNPVAVTDTANLNFGKHHVVTVTAADKTLTLPAVSGNGGKMLSIEIASTTTKLITIDGNASETIDGATTRIMWASETCLLLCNGTTWTKMAGKSIPMIAIASTSADIIGSQFPAGATPIDLSMNTATLQCNGMVDTSTGYIFIKRPGNYTISGTMLYSPSSSISTYIRLLIRGTFQGTAGTTMIDAYYPYLASTLNQILTFKEFNLYINDKVCLGTSYAAGNYAAGTTIVYGGYTYNNLTVKELVTW